MSDPLVSVVVPSYQHAEFVAVAIESVLVQTVADLEVVVVDDGSTDGTPDIVAALDDPRIRLVRLPENRREHARNLGLRLARGRFVAFQNSDDEWLPGKLAAQLDVLERRADVGAVFTAVELIDEDGLPVSGTWADGQFCDGARERTSAEWLRQFFWRNCLCITSALVRHDLLREVGRFRPSLVQLADVDLWIRLAARANLHVVPEPLTRMRIGARNLSAPHPGHQARIAMEWADVLENYARPPLLGRLAEIFPDAFPDGPDAEPVVDLAAFACHAAAGRDLSRRLLADRVLGRLIDDDESREKLASRFGNRIFKHFLDLRTQWTISAGQP
ncbi:MAG: glycosyltransferase [Candidatus Sericytochromatia bacterium]|nr:glycosyltransferase [Candidatus Tanganyikabacteria bacterium]